MPALSGCARFLVESGRHDEAAALYEEILGPGERYFGALIDLGWVMHDLGLPDAARLDEGGGVWGLAGAHIARGEFEAAGALLARTGLHTEAAYARLRAAEDLTGAERGALLEPALAFYRARRRHRVCAPSGGPPARLQHDVCPPSSRMPAWGISATRRAPNRAPRTPPSDRSTLRTRSLLHHQRSARRAFLVMLVVTGGRERSGDQFRRLFERSGLQHRRTLETTSPWSVVEAVVSLLSEPDGRR